MAKTKRPELTPQALADKIWKGLHLVEEGNLDIETYRVQVYGASILLKAAKVTHIPHTKPDGDDE